MLYVGPTTYNVRKTVLCLLHPLYAFRSELEYTESLQKMRCGLVKFYPAVALPGLPLVVLNYILHTISGALVKSAFLSISD